MPKPKFFFCETGPLSALVVAVTLAGGIVSASAQFYNFGDSRQRQQPFSGGFNSGGWFGGDGIAPFQETPRQYLRRRKAPRQTQAPKQAHVPKQAVEDFSKAPPPERSETLPEHKVLVLGDGMADWLAYGLEEAYAEQPEIGVIRKVKTVSGLIKYQPKGDFVDWAVIAKGLLDAEAPDAIVVMLGLNDRVSIREPAIAKPGEKNDKKGFDVKQASKPGGTKPGSAAKLGAEPDEAVAKPQDKTADTETSPGDADDNSNARPELTPKNSSRSPNGVYEFREKRWVELYIKKIEQMIRLMKSKGVPVLWVGLPAIRGTTATSDMLFLNSLYRDAAGKAGITYVDVWDGFVDEADRFLQKGPDFDGQIRQLRSSDGVYFTKSGARKLAHYAERDIHRLLAARSTPVALPAEPATPGPIAPISRPAARTLEGPILPLVTSSIISDRLLGGPDLRPAADDTLATRTLMKGEPLAPPAGRADDPAWPRREVGDERDHKATPLAEK